MAGPSLYEEMLQHQSWADMLDQDSDMGEQPAEEQEGFVEEPRGGFGRGYCGGRGGGGRCGRGFGRGFGGHGFPPFFGPHGMPFLQFAMGPSPMNGPPPPPPPPPPHGPPGPPPHHGHHHGLPHHGPPPHGRHGHGHRGKPGRHHGPPCGLLVDIFEEAAGQQYVLLASVPGFSKKDVALTVADKTLTIKGKLPHHGAGEDARPLLHERPPLTSFDRSFQLSDDIDAAKIAAKLEHGLLRVVLPRKAGVEPKVVPVGSSSSDDEEFVAVDDHEEEAQPNTAM